jgi:hypothetical protein
MQKLKIFLVIICSLSILDFSAQKTLRPGKKRKSDVFGKTDYKDYRFYGLQWSIGPTYLLTKSKNTIYNTTDVTGRPMTYSQDPYGMPGIFAEVGLAHFPKKTSKLAKILKTTLVSYYDWGVGFKLFGGGERTKTDYMDAAGNIVNTIKGSGQFYNGYVYGRFSIHKNIHLNKKYFFDNALGFNFDYRVLENKNHTAITSGDRYQAPFVAQIHYGLGFGIHPNRRFTIIPSVQMPIFGMFEWRKGSAAMAWYSSNYVPIQAQVKFIYLFEKKAKGCAPAKGNDEDKKRNEEFMEGN